MNSGFSRRRGVVLATLAVTSLGMGFACAPATFAADSDIVINEVTTQGRDAIELANKGAQDIDIAGWTIFDSDDGKGNKPIVFPAGTIIPAGGYFVFYPDSKEGGIAPDGSAGFGLDGNDSLELKNASGKRIDFQSWTSDPRVRQSGYIMVAHPGHDRRDGRCTSDNTRWFELRRAEERHQGHR